MKEVNSRDMEKVHWRKLNESLNVGVKESSKGHLKLFPLMTFPGELTVVLFIKRGTIRERVVSRGSSGAHA